MFSRWAHETFFALRYSNYRTLWIGTTLAFLAFMMSWIVQAVVAFDLTGKNAAVGIVGLGQGVSQIAIAPFGGVLADRVSKRKLLLIGQSTMGFTFAIVGVLVLTDNITIPLLLVSTFVMGVVFSFIGPARQAWIGELLPPNVMGNGIALQQVAMTATRVLGPMIAGLLVGWSFVGPGGAYLFMAGIFIIVVATLLSLPPTKSTAKRGSSVKGDFVLGYQHVSQKPRLKLLVLSFIGVVIAGYSWQVLLPGMLENELNIDPEKVGWLVSSSAVSGLAVTLLMASKAGSPSAWKLMYIGAVMIGVALLLLAATPSYFAAIGIMLILGAGTGAFQMLNNSLIMQESDPQYFGRVMALTFMAWGFNGLFGLPFGMLADAVGERQTLYLMGSLVCAVTIVSFLSHQLISRREIPAARPEPRLAGGK